MIYQAQHLYAVLHVEQYTLTIENKTGYNRPERIVRRLPPLSTLIKPLYFVLSAHIGIIKNP
jgi:hypothetical protein